MRKFLSGLLIGAFVFGVSAADIQPASAESSKDYKQVKQKIDKSKQKLDKAQEKYNQNKKSGENPPEPPKDENGNPMPPPDRNSDDSNRPAPPDRNNNSR